VKIGPVDAEIYSVDLKKKKFQKVKYRPIALPSGLNDFCYISPTCPEASRGRIHQIWYWGTNRGHNHHWTDVLLNREHLFNLVEIASYMNNTTA